MKALTICQPYAELIACGEKRVENRTWATSYRGDLLIHAGKSRDWLDLGTDAKGNEVDRPTGIYISTMDFGAIVANAKLIDCLNVEAIMKGSHDEQYPWLRSHQHVLGPWCWVLADVTRIEPGIPWTGAQGLWEYRAPSAVAG
jgi:hypothetical protein